ncbi:oxysterol-binding protein-related protein 11 [Trichonephila clavipes]|nr:oxysterol-binding protein-related protein 11 [Trichonephila clavipes]
MPPLEFVAPDRGPVCLALEPLLTGASQSLSYKSQFQRCMHTQFHQILKTPAGLHCHTGLSDKFVAVDDGNVSTAPLMTDKDVLEFVQNSKNIIDADSDDENEQCSSCSHVTRNEASRSDQSNNFQSNFALCKGSSTKLSEELQHSSSATNLNSEKLSETVPETQSKDKPTEAPVDAVNKIKDSVFKAVECQKALAKSIEELPFSGPHIKCSDSNLLLIKAISQAAVQSLEQCYIILRRQRQREALRSNPLSTGPSVDSLDKFKGSDM